MDKASLVLSLGPDFRLMGPDTTMLKADVPVVAVCAVRTGSGKSQTSRRVVDVLRQMGLKVVVVRHPMPYGDLTKEVCQRFGSTQDLDRYQVTIEEREEYEQHIEAGNVVFAGADYEAILRCATQEAEVIVWDGGNNDLPFYRPDLHIVVADPHRAGHERTYYPGETNFRMANVIVINKVDTARHEDVELVRHNALELNPSAIIVEAASPITVDRPELISGRSVLVIEDGPTLTHGEMPYGAGTVAARLHAAGEVVDPRPYAVGSIVEIYSKFPHIGPVLPAMGYSERQIEELQQTIERTPADTVVVATPIDLRRVVKVKRPLVRVRYSLKELTSPSLEDILRERFRGAASDLA
jgi:predicted GTPase